MEAVLALAPEEPFRLNVLITEVAAPLEERNYSQIATLVLSQIPRARREEVLHLLLTERSRSVLAQNRCHAATDASRAAAEMQELGGTRRGRSRSARWERAAEVVEERAQRLWEQDAGAGLHKRLGDCSTGDVLAMINVMRANIEASQRRLGQYERLLEAMRRRRVSRTRDLPAEVMVAAFTED